MRRKKSKSKNKNTSLQPSKQEKSSPHSIAGSMLFEVENRYGKKVTKWLADEKLRKLNKFCELIADYDLFGGGIVHESFDIPRNLREAFKQVARRKYGSMCKAYLLFSAFEVAEHLLKKHALGNTLSDIVPMVLNVPKVELPVYIQSRPRRYVRDSGEISESLDDDDFINKFGIWCILKQSRFRHIRDLPCFFWNSCKCGNANCWSRLRPLILKFKGHNGTTKD